MAAETSTQKSLPGNLRCGAQVDDQVNSKIELWVAHQVVEPARQHLVLRLRHEAIPSQVFREAVLGAVNASLHKFY